MSSRQVVPTASEPKRLNMPNAATCTQFFVSGFVKLDAMQTRSADGELARDL